MDAFEDVRMVLPTFPAYVELNRQAAREWRAKGPRDPIAAHYTKLLQKLEAAVRSVLALQFPEHEARILSFVQSRGEPVRERRIFREIDFVGERAGEPWLFLEIKARETCGSDRGTGQLGKSLHIGRQRWPELQGLWLNLFMGTVLGIESELSPEMVSIAPLPFGPDDADGPDDAQDPVVLWVDGGEMMACAMDRGFLPGDFVEELKAARSAVADPLGHWARTRRPRTGSTDTSPSAGGAPS
jgi:hypothetical protein